MAKCEALRVAMYKTETWTSLKEDERRIETHKNGFGERWQNWAEWTYWIWGDKKNRIKNGNVRNDYKNKNIPD